MGKRLVDKLLRYSTSREECVSRTLATISVDAAAELFNSAGHPERLELTREDLATVIAKTSSAVLEVMTAGLAGKLS